MAMSILIKNGTVLTITEGVKENTDVLIKNGKISKIGKISRNKEKSFFITKKGEHLLIKSPGYKHQF